MTQDKASDIIQYLKALERYGEDNIWRTAQAAREEIERLRAALAASSASPASSAAPAGQEQSPQGHEAGRSTQGARTDAAGESGGESS